VQDASGRDAAWRWRFKNLDEKGARVDFRTKALSASDLQPGAYEITASKSGFTSAKTSRLALDAASNYEWI